MDAPAESRSGTATAPSTEFKVVSELSEFQVPAREYIAAHPELNVHGLATGVVVMDGNRALLVQRSFSDSMPGLWETPGGACDDDDASILIGAARELWEEAGLQVESMLGTAGKPWTFKTKSRRLVIIKFTFVARVKRQFSNGEIEVKLSHEHHDFVWATVDEIKCGRCGDKVLEFTSRDQKQIIMDAMSSGLDHSL
jgi:8-oxo-dGTP pyrophosphatase MutT (NUDIX family)